MMFITDRIRLKLNYIKSKLADSPLLYRFARGSFWALVGGVGSRFFTLIANVLVARILGKTAFGEFGMVQSTMMVFGIMAGFGMGSTATRFIAQARYVDVNRVARIVNLTLFISFGFGLILTIICQFSSNWLATAFLSHPATADYLRAGALLFLFTTLNNVLIGILSGFEAFREIAKINLLQGVLAPIISIPFAWLYGVGGVIASFTINAALGILLCAFALRIQYRKYSVPDSVIVSGFYNELPILWEHSIPAMLQGLMVVPVTWITNVMLVNQPKGYGELGLFNAASQWRTLILFMPGLLASVIIPILSETHSQNDNGAFNRTISLNFRITWLLSLPITVAVITLGKPLASVFGKDFGGAAPIIVILVLSCFVTVVSSTVGTALVGSGRMWVGTLLNLGWASILVVLAFLLIPAYGALGLSVAYLVAYLFQGFCTIIFVERCLAPTAIISQGKLISYSVVLFGVVVVTVVYQINSIIVNVVLVILSLIPILQLLIKKSSVIGLANNVHEN